MGIQMGEEEKSWGNIAKNRRMNVEWIKWSMSFSRPIDDM